MPNNFDKLFNQQQGNDLINALKGIKSSLDVNYPLETVNVTLSNNAQNITPSANYYGLGQVNVPGMNLSDMTILVNGNYDPVTSGLDGYGKLNVNVPTWGQADEGKVVSNNALVPQTNREVNANGTYDTTLNNSVLVNVPNTYGSEDEGKVVMNNALVPQTNRSITENGTYDTTTNDEVVVDVQSGGDAKIYRFIDETYYMEETGLICTLGSRAYTKTYSDPAFVAYYSGTSEYTGPLLVSKTENGATYTTEGVTFRPTQETIDGETWYVSNTEYFVRSSVSTAGYATKLTGSYATAKLAAEALLQLAYDNTITENGSYPVPEGYDGFGDFNVDVEADTETLSVTQNGTYTPSTGKDGFSQVTVNVQGGGGGGSVLVETPVYARVTADSEFHNTVSGMGQPFAANAMGSDTYSWWGADSNAQHYLLITIPEAIAIKQVKFSNYWSNGSSTWHSSRVVLEGSNDNTTWDTLLDETDLPQSDIQNEYLLQNTTAYLYYKFTCYSTTQYYTGLGKVQLFYEISGGGSGGSKNILSGTEAPTSSIGEDGDIYLQYSDTSNRGYLQNTGSSYLNTNYIPKSNSKFVLECNITGGESNFVPFGARETSSTAAAAKGVYTIRGDSYVFGYCFGTALVQQSGTNYNNFLDKDVTITLSGSLAKITDGTDTLEYSFTGGTPTTYPIFLFGLNQAGTNLSACYCYMKAYRFKIYEGDVLVADYVPAIYDGSAGMRNLINGIFFEATGTMNVDPYSNAGDIVSTYCKVDGAWQPLIDTDIDDVNTEGSGGSKNILGGTTNPTSADGTDGDIYIKYTDYSSGTFPSGYTPIEYIESSSNGGQYIDTDYSPNANSEIYFRAFIYTGGNSGNRAVWGTTSPFHWIISHINDSPNLTYAWGGTDSRLGGNITGQIVKVTAKKGDVTALADDGTLIQHNTPSAGNNTGSGKILIFRGDGTNTSTYMRLYRFEVRENDTAIRIMQPAKRNSDDVLGMYDLVNDVFYTNSGTGSFIGGEELTGTPIDTVYLKVDGDWIILEDGDYSDVNTEGGSGKLYTNSKVYESEAQITDVTGFTKVYNTSVRYGNNGAKVSARLDVTDESAIETFMSGGWNASGMAYYDAENLIGAYGGYDFGEELTISKVKLWIGRYSGQNNNLNVTLQWLDGNGVWNDVIQNDLVVAINLSYPVNVFECLINLSCYGIRWIHKNAPNKSGGNNITFAGMTIYEGTGEFIDVYTPTQTGLIQVPTGYDGFGPLYIAP